MDEESAAIYQGIFDSVAELRAGRRLRSYKTLAYADILDTQNRLYIVGSMNGAGGLMSRPFRGTAGVKYFSVSSRTTGGVVHIEPNGPIERADNRHAEMNVVMYALSKHVSRGGTVDDFVLDNYMVGLNPSQRFCPECQLAIALLSAGGARLVSSISELVREGGAPVLLMRTVSDRMLSPRWAPPWSTYYQDIPGSNYFRRQDGSLRNGRGPFAIELQGSSIAICEPDTTGTLRAVQLVGVHHG